jgi:DNA-directed RNA polymerase subunit L
MATAQFSNLKRSAASAMTFTFSPLKHTYANSLIRLIISGVETIGFRGDMDGAGRTGDVVVEKNDTPMTNEMLAHRISMLPIHVRDPLSFKPEDYEFILRVQNDGDRSRDVVASDIEVFRRGDGDDAEPVRMDPTQFFPANRFGDTCLIAMLKPKRFGMEIGEAIRLRAKASMGTGRMHAGFIPTSQASYTYSLDTDEDRRRAVFDEWLDKSKKLSAAEVDGDPAKKAALTKEFETMQVARCYLRDENSEPYSYDFVVESVGPLDVPYVVRRACEVGEAMCMRYANLATGDLPEDVRITPADAEMLGFDFEFTGHDHTLRYLLTTYLVENHLSLGAEPKIQFASGDVRHPLRDVMTIRIGVEDGQEGTARTAVAAAARGCAEMFRSWRTNWMMAMGQSQGAGAPKLTIRRSGAGAGAGAGGK